jgi:hypothetical protein
MGQPKKQTSPRKAGTRRSHLVLDLARRVNATSPVKVRTTKRENSKKLVLVSEDASTSKVAKKPTKKPVKKIAA